MVLDKAKELGIALSETEEFQYMLDAKAAFENDELSNHLLSEYNQTQDLIMSLLENEEEVDPVRITALSQDLERLKGELTAMPAFNEMMRAQRQFQSLMQQVNQVVGEYIGMSGMTVDEEFTFSEGCGGSCASCSCCKH